MSKKKPQDAVAWAGFCAAQGKWKASCATAGTEDRTRLLNDYRREARKLVRELALSR